MKIKELVEKLKGFDQNLPVVLDYDSEGWNVIAAEVTEVNLLEDVEASPSEKAVSLFIQH